MENNVSLLILADDLTGALDTGVQFAKKGTDVEVYLTLDDAAQGLRETGAEPQADVRVVNTDTRHASAEEARRVVTAAVKAFRDCTHFYKKTDSCLRGNIGAELEALMKATGCSRLPFVPAYPALRRTTRAGYQYLDGVLIHRSSMANDPLNPVTESFIPSIIGRQSKIPVRLVGTDLQGIGHGLSPGTGQAGGTDPESGLLGSVPEMGTEHILVFDGETPAHLEAAANALREEGLLRVSAGCAGFAEALMEALPFAQRDEGVSALAIGERLPILVVSGSLNPVSIAQIEAAREKGIACFGVAEEDLLAEGWLDSERERSLAVGIHAADCRRLLRQRGIAVLGTDLAIGTRTVGIHAVGTSADRTAPVRGDARQTAVQVASGLGKIVRSITDETGPLHLVVFGGDTLLGIMKTFGYKYLRPLEEIFPGVVLAKKGEGQFSGWLVTKSGAFGDRALIQTIEEFLRN